MFGADCGIVIDVGKLAGSTDRNSCGIWKTWFSSVVFSVTRTLPWNVKICEMSLRLALSSPEPDGEMPTPISTLNMPAIPGMPLEVCAWYWRISSPVSRPEMPSGAMLPPAVKKNVVWLAVIFSRKPPSMCTHSVGLLLDSVFGS